MKFENLAFLCESSKIENGIALENTIVNTSLDDTATLSNSEITDAVDTLTSLMENCSLDEPTAQFILGSVAESAFDIFDTDIFALEGKNMELVSEVMPLKSEINSQLKALKKCMKKGSYGDAKSVCDSINKSIDKLEKVLKNAQDDGMVSSCIGSIIGAVPIILRSLASSLIAIPLSFIGLGVVPVLVNAIYTIKESIELTFAQTSTILKNKEVSWNDLNTYKKSAERLINIARSQVKNYQKVLSKLDGGKSGDNDLDPASSQKLNDAKSSLSDSLNGLTKATKKKK